MADLQHKISMHQDDIDRAKAQIEDSTQKADTYLTGLTKQVEEYEKTHSNFEPAGDYLKSALDAARSATQKLKTQGKDLSERSVPVAVDGMREVRDSLDELQTQAVAYDDKYAGSRGQHAMDTLHGMVNSGRQRATEALETTGEQLARLRDAISNAAGQASHGAQVVVGEAVRVAEMGDEKLGVSSKAGGVVQKVRDLDERLCLTATVAKVDTKVTGGIGCKVAATTVDIVSESVSYISETLQSAKLAAEHSGTAQGAEQKVGAAAEAATQKKDEVVETFVEAYEGGEQKITSGTEMAKQKAGMAKENTEETAGMAKNKAGEMTETAKDKAGDVKESVKDKAGQATAKTGEMAGAAKDKAGNMKDTAQQKAGQGKDKASDVKDATQEKAGQAKDTTLEKAGQMKESAQDTAAQVKDTAQDKAGTAKKKTEETSGMAKEKAGDVKEKTKEKASETKDQAQGQTGESQEKKGFFSKVKDKVTGAASGAGTSVEAKTMKLKEPTTTQEETDSEKALEGLKQARAKDSEAAKTSAGVARSEDEGTHTKSDKTTGQHQQPGFQAAQAQATHSK